MGEKLKFSIGDMYITNKETGEQTKLGGVNDIEVNCTENKYYKDLHSSLLNCAQSIEFTGRTTAKENEFLSRMYEEFERYRNMTPKEKTLKATKGLYDTIFVPTTQIMDELVKEFGELNYIVNGYVCGVVLYNSMEE